MHNGYSKMPASVSSTLSQMRQKKVAELADSPVLPRTDVSIARALNALYCRTAPCDLPARGGTCQLRWQPQTTRAGDETSYRFVIGSHVGHLGLSARALAVLLQETRASLLPRELRYILLAEALQATVEIVERTTRLRFEWSPGSDDSDSFVPDAQRAAFFSFTHAHNADSFDGYLQLEDGAALGMLADALPRVIVARPGIAHWLRFPATFVLGTTALSLREVSSIRPGDIVSIENWRAAGPALVVTATLGGSLGPQLVGHAEGSRITIQQLKEPPMNRDAKVTAASDENDVANLPLDRLDAMEVSLRFEVGELSVSLGELKSISNGHVFELPQPLNRSPVRILAHGNVLGNGYLVAVGDQLGVRVTEFAPSEI